MNLDGKKLPRNFYLRPTLHVARDLIRKTIIFYHPDGIVAGDIVEVEAYIGEDDPACHAANGKTPRNGIMYGQGGYSYIYFIYGMYHCFNIVTEKEGFPAAVLVRAVEPVSGVDIMQKSSLQPIRKLTNGPGKFCRAFCLNRDYNGIDLTGNKLYLIDRGLVKLKLKKTPRIGIKKATRRPWRFFDANSDCISR